MSASDLEPSPPAAATLRPPVASPAVRRAVGVLAMAALTAAGARVAVPLPVTPVPFTFQVVAVLLAGYVLGPGAAAASQAAYLAAGVAGLPVFAGGGGPAYLLGPTGGYLIAFPAAAAVVGLVVARRDGPVAHLAGLAGGLALIHATGAGWLALAGGASEALAAGVVPFLASDAVKVLLVLVLGRRIGAPARRFLGG